MRRWSPRRELAERILADPESSEDDRAAASAVIRELDAKSEYQNAYEKRRREEDPNYRDARHKSKAEWKQRNKAAVYAGVRRHHIKRLREDPKFRIDALMRTTLHQAFTMVRKRSRYLDHLDWTFDSLRAHLAAQFTSGMTWQNWGEVWEIDHIEPRAVFNYDTMAHPDFVKCWSLANMRPMLKRENREQGYVLARFANLRG